MKQDDSITSAGTEITFYNYMSKSLPGRNNSGAEIL